MCAQKRSNHVLVKAHLENVSRDLLEDEIFRQIVRDHVKGQSGIYALYREKQLTYVGLASDLPNRLSQHLRDRHSDSWNRFSIYLTVNANQMRELESLIIRITRPKGNKVRGGFIESENLKSKMMSDARRKQKEKLDRIFGKKKKIEQQSKSKKAIRIKVAKKAKTSASLEPFAETRFMLKMENKGKIYKAWVKKGGYIRYDSRLFRTPSAAAKYIIGENINGWAAWMYKNEDGKWVKLDYLRRKAKKKLAKPKNKKDIKKNTIICPAREDGFQETFIGENCWYYIRLSKKRIDDIRFIAIYRTRPTSAITHYAVVEKIEPHKKSGKYIVYFKGKPRKLRQPITVDEALPRHIQGPILTSWKKFRAAKTINDL